MGFLVIRKSELPVKRLFNGKAPGLASVSYQKNGNLLFSKAAAGVFGAYTTCKIEWDEGQRMLLLTGTDKPPRNCTEADLFKLNRRMYKGTVSNISIAVRLLFQELQIDISAPYKFEIRLDAEHNSIAVVLPEAGAGAFAPGPIVDATVDAHELTAGASD